MGRNNRYRIQKNPEITKDLLAEAALLSPYGQVITRYSQGKYQIIHINEAFEELTGYCFEDVKHMDFKLLFNNNSSLHPLEHFRDATKYGRRCTDVVSSYKKDGSHFHNELTVTPIQSHDGEAAHLCWTIRDVSHFVRQEKDLLQQIKQKEKRFAAYQINSSEALWRIDFSPPISLQLPVNEQVQAVFNSGVYTEANDNTAKAYGYKKGRDLIGVPLNQFLTEKDMNSGMNVSRIVREKFNIDKWITHERGQSGEKIVALNNITPHIKGGKVHHIWGASHVVTDLFLAKDDALKSQEKLHSQKKSLERKNIALNELISQIELEKKEFKDRIMANIEQVILPSLNRIDNHENNQLDTEYIKTALINLTSSLGRKINFLKVNLSPREIEVCTLVKNGMSNKEIATMLNISKYTVEVHRRNLREKLGLKNKQQNLRTFLNAS